MRCCNTTHPEKRSDFTLEEIANVQQPLLENRMNPIRSLGRTTLFLQIFFALILNSGHAPAAEVTLDMLDMLPQEQKMLEGLAGARSFEVMKGPDVGSKPGRRRGPIIVEDIDITSMDGSRFTLYAVDEDGAGYELEIEVLQDGALSVYERASDSVEFWHGTAVSDQSIVRTVGGERIKSDPGVSSAAGMADSDITQGDPQTTGPVSKEGHRIPGGNVSIRIGDGCQSLRDEIEIRELQLEFLAEMEEKYCKRILSLEPDDPGAPEEKPQDMCEVTQDQIRKYQNEVEVLALQLQICEAI